MERTTRYGEIPYGKGVRYYNTAKAPLRQLGIFTWLIWFLSKILMKGSPIASRRSAWRGLSRRIFC